VRIPVARTTRPKGEKNERTTFSFHSFHSFLSLPQFSSQFMMLHRYKQSRRQHQHHQHHQVHQHDRSSSSFPSSTATASFGSRHGHQNGNKLLRLPQDQQQGGCRVLDDLVGLNDVQHSSTSIRGCGMLPVEGSDVLALLGGDVPNRTPVATDRTTTATTCSHRLDNTHVHNLSTTSTATTTPTTSSNHASTLKASKPTMTISKTYATTATATASSMSQSLSEAARSMSAEDYLDSYEDFWKNKNTNANSNSSTTKNDKSSSRPHLQQQQQQQHKKKKIGDDCGGNGRGNSSTNSNDNTINVEVIDLTMEDDDDDDDEAVKASHPSRHPIISVGSHDKNGSSLRISHNLLRGAIFLSNGNGKSSTAAVESCRTSTPTEYPTSTGKDRTTPNNENAARQSSHKIKKSVRRVGFGVTTVATNSSKGSERTAALRVSSTMKQPPKSSAAAAAASPTESSSMPTISSSRGRRNHHRGGGSSRPGCTTRTTDEVGLIVPYTFPEQHHHYSDATSMTSMVTATAPYPYPYGLSGYSQHDQYQYQQHQQPSCPHYDESSRCHLPYNYGGTLDTIPTGQFYHGYNDHNHERSMRASSMSRSMLASSMSRTMSTKISSSSSASPYAPSQQFYAMMSHPVLSNEQQHGHGHGQGSYYAREYCVSTNSSNPHHSSTSAAMAGATGGSGMGLGLLQSSGYHRPILTSTSLDPTTAIFATPTTILTTTPASSSSRRGSMTSNISSLTYDSSADVDGTARDLDLDRNRSTMSGTSSKTGIKISPIAERSTATKKNKNFITGKSGSEEQEQVPIHLERDDEPKSITTSQSHHKARFPTKPTWKGSEVSRSDKQPQEPELVLPPQQQRTIASVDNKKHNHKMSSTISTSPRSTKIAAQGISVPSSSSSLILSKSSSSQSVPRDLFTSDRPEKRHDRQDIGGTTTNMIASAATTPVLEAMKKKIIEKKTKEVVVTVTKKPLKKSKPKLNNVEHTNKKKDKTIVATKMSSKNVKKKLKNGQNKEIKKHIVTKLSVPSSSSNNHNIQPGILGRTKTDRFSTRRNNQSRHAASQLQPSVVSSLSPTSTTQKKKVVRINFVKKIERLAHPTDCLNVNSLHCFVRQELLDVFVLSPGNSENTDVIRRVGLRCAYCGHLSKSKREKGIDGISGCHNMSSFYPKSIEDLYRSVCVWQRVHFPNCPYVPDNIKSKYSLLKQHDLSRGKTRHWERTARLMGLRNASNSDRQGIVYRPIENMKTTSEPSSGTTVSEPSYNKTPTIPTITTTPTTITATKCDQSINE